MSLAAVQENLIWQFFGCRPDGFFIQVGDPINGLQTWLLEQNGWQGFFIANLLV